MSRHAGANCVSGNTAFVNSSDGAAEPGDWIVGGRPSVNILRFGVIILAAAWHRTGTEICIRNKLKLHIPLGRPTSDSTVSAVDTVPGLSRAGPAHIATLLGEIEIDSGPTLLHILRFGAGSVADWSWSCLDLGLENKEPGRQDRENHEARIDYTWPFHETSPKRLGCGQTVRRGVGPMATPPPQEGKSSHSKDQTCANGRAG